MEEAYEFFLAFAAQGLHDDRSSASGSQLRNFLSRMDESLAGLAASFRTVLADGSVASPGDFDDMIDVLEQDARTARAVLRVVLSRPSISSQLIDNLNASMHIRALLTDVFVLDEALAIGD